jgi:diacylglycerol kinase (ATP)
VVTPAARCSILDSPVLTPVFRYLPSQCTDVLISVNPSAGSGARGGMVDALAESLRESWLNVEVLTSIQAVAEAAREKSRRGRLRAVIAAGGDGTFRLVAEHTTAEMPLAILPLGTENLLSKHLEVPAEPADIAAVVVAGCHVQLDAGEANGKLFTLMAGCGFDADVVRRLHSERKGNIHHLSYAKPIFDSIRNYDYPLLRVKYAAAGEPGATPAEEQCVEGKWVFVINLPRYAGGLNIAPGASGSDGLLDICTFKEGSLWSGLLYLGEVMFGQHQLLEDFTQVQAAELRVEAESAVSYQLDGDPGGELPLVVRSLPGRLRVIVSREWAETNGYEEEK